jgi:hypothetical protein
MSDSEKPRYVPDASLAAPPGNGPGTTAAVRARWFELSEPAGLNALWIFAVAAMACAALYLVGKLLIWEITHTWGIPLYDDIFDHLRLYRTAGSLAALLDYLFSLHNEHRIFTTRLLMLFDERLDAGREFIPIAASNLLQFGSAIVCIAAVYRDRPSRLVSLSTLWVGSLIVLLFVNANLLETLDVPFQVQHAIMGFLSALTAWVVGAAEGRRLRPDRDRWWLAKLVVLAAVGFVTLGNSPALLIGAFCALVIFRWPIGWTALVGALAALCAAVVLATTPGVGAKTTDPVALLGFTTLYLGSPFVRIVPWPSAFVSWSTSLAWTEVWGAIVLAVPAVFALWQFFRPRPGRSLAVFGFVLCTIVIVTALAAAYSRAQFGIEAATDKKYASFAALGWVGCFLIALAVAREIFGAASAAAAVLITAAYAVMLPLSAAAQSRETLIWGNFRERNWNAAMAAFTGVPDRETLQDIYPDPPSVHEYIDDLELRGRSIFARYPFRMGEPSAAALGHRREVPCRSEVEDVHILPQSDIASPLRRPGSPVKIHGWTWMTTAQQPADAVVVVDPSDHIVGLARSTGISVRAESWLSQEFSQPLAWSGYALTDAVHDMRFFALSANGRSYCALGRPGETR